MSFFSGKITTSHEEIHKERIQVVNLLTNLIAENAPAMEKKGIVPEIILPYHFVDTAFS